jgi:hypothetical protein
MLPRQKDAYIHRHIMLEQTGDLPHYTSDYAAAMMVVQRYSAIYEIESPRRILNTERWICKAHQRTNAPENDGSYMETGATQAEAICCAILSAENIFTEFDDYDA